MKTDLTRIGFLLYREIERKKKREREGLLSALPAISKSRDIKSNAATLNVHFIPRCTAAVS